tara:strand:- start:599 stop:880 length:282 start_codon:yes stop_codon:yes gene_type:complete
MRRFYSGYTVVDLGAQREAWDAEILEHYARLSGLPNEAVRQTYEDNRWKDSYILATLFDGIAYLFTPERAIKVEAARMVLKDRGETLSIDDSF